MYNQQPSEIQKIVSSWLNDVIAGRRPGKDYLTGTSGEQNEYNLTAIFEYALHRWGVFAPSYLDEAVKILGKSNRLRLQSAQNAQPARPDLDISKPAASKGSPISLSSGGSVQDILSKFLNGVAGVHSSWDKQEQDRKKAFVPLPRRELTEREMRLATKEQLRDWTQWRNNADTRSGGEIR